MISGATDLFYLAVMALDDAPLEDYHSGVLRPYHEELCAALGGKGGGAAYPYEQLEAEFKFAGIDCNSAGPRTLVARCLCSLDQRSSPDPVAVFRWVSGARGLSPLWGNSP